MSELMTIRDIMQLRKIGYPTAAALVVKTDFQTHVKGGHRSGSPKYWRTSDVYRYFGLSRSDIRLDFLRGAYDPRHKIEAADARLARARSTKLKTKRFLSGGCND